MIEDTRRLIDTAFYIIDALAKEGHFNVSIEELCNYLQRDKVIKQIQKELENNG